MKKTLNGPGAIETLRTKILDFFVPIGASVLSGFLLLWAFPNYNLAWLAWVALVPLFVTIAGRKIALGFLLALISGAIFLVGYFRGNIGAGAYNQLHHVILALCYGPLFALIGLSFNYIAKRSGTTAALFSAPFVFVCLEYVRSNLSFLAMPMGLLAHSQYGYPQIIQIASITGAYGVSFLIVTVNSAIAALVLVVVSNFKVSRSASSIYISRHGLIAIVCTAAVLSILTVSYGQLKTSKPILGEEIKVSVVQGNIEQNKKWNPGYKSYIMSTYAELTLEASRNQPALIIWPEAATQRMISGDRGLHSEVRRIAETAGTSLLLGSSSHQKFKQGKDKKVKFYNAAFFINPVDKGVNQRYDKIRLVPFGEYMPLRGTIPWQWLGLPHVRDYTSGKEFTVFEGPGFRFSGTICWENIFPDLVRQFVKSGAQFIVNITNEAWFGRSAGSQHFVTISVLRAVENRVYVVRCANTGISCFIDPYGRIVNRVKNPKGQDLFVRGVLTDKVIPMKSNTIYTRYGDLIVWVCFAISIGFIVFALVRKNACQDSD